jgi:hypothetical protein
MPPHYVVVDRPSPLCSSSALNLEPIVGILARVLKNASSLTLTQRQRLLLTALERLDYAPSSMCPATKQHNAGAASRQAGVDSITIHLKRSAPVLWKERLRVLCSPRQAELEDDTGGSGT